jgi:hypothetical protein
MPLQSETVIDSGWRLSPGTITKVGFAFVFSPMITNNICSIASGAYAEQGDVFKANVFARLLYGLCKHLSLHAYKCCYATKTQHFLILIGSFYCVMLAICVLYSGIRLMRLLDHHLQMLGSGNRYELVKTGRLKVRD